jgi:hypothetical protein
MIATVGRTGRATAEHLHFEIRRDGVAFNPVHLLEARTSGPLLASATSDDAPPFLPTPEGAEPEVESPAADMDEAHPQDVL